jgi:hypothetical protein
MTLPLHDHNRYLLVQPNTIDSIILDQQGTLPMNRRLRYTALPQLRGRTERLTNSVVGFRGGGGTIWIGLNGGIRVVH